VLRPASRRASQQSASPHGDGPAPYEHDPYAQNGAPYPPDGAPYRPDGSPYGPDPSYYRPHPPPYQPSPAPYPPNPSPYGPPSRYEPQPYDLDDTMPLRDGGSRGPQPPRRGRRRKGSGGATGAKGPGRVRRLLRRPTVRVILALIAVLCCWLAFSIGQALTAPGGGSLSTKLAEWARDHYLGPVVTFGEWLTYSPPKVGGKPAFSFVVPKGSQQKFKHVQGFQPIIPARLSSPAGTPLPGEGVWRVLETVKGEPAIFGTFLRVDAVHTSYASGIVSMDQRLVTFQLRPGSEDPGPGHWNAQPWIPPGTRAGLLATFNGGFKLDSSGGGFYLNGSYRGTLTDGAASVVYYRNGTIRIGEWGQHLGMTPDVVGVRQNLRLIVDHGQVPASVNQDVLGSWGATLGGGYYVWRSGLGITKDGRIIFVYGDRLDVQDLADLLQRAGAVEALQLDINPEWMAFDYYQADGHPTDPTPVNLLPDQQGTPYRYYSVYSRDFTAVYAR